MFPNSHHTVIICFELPFLCLYTLILIIGHFFSILVVVYVKCINLSFNQVKCLKSWWQFNSSVSIYVLLLIPSVKRPIVIFFLVSKWSDKTLGNLGEFVGKKFNSFVIMCFLLAWVRWRWNNTSFVYVCDDYFKLEERK